MRGGTTHGATDEFGYYVAENKVTMPDFHATVLHLLGLDHHEADVPPRGPRLPPHRCVRGSGTTDPRVTVGGDTAIRVCVAGASGWTGREVAKVTSSWHWVGRALAFVEALPAR